MKKPQTPFKTFPLKDAGVIILLIILPFLGFFTSCNPPAPKPGPDTVKSGDQAQPLAGIPDESFYCLRAGQDTVKRWLDSADHDNKFKKLVLSYFWPNRNQNYFTLIVNRKDRLSEEYTDKTDTLGSDGVCSVTNLGIPLVMSGNQISIKMIRKLWRFATDPNVYYYLKFTPKIGVGVDDQDHVFNYPNYLVYQVDLVPTPGGAGTAYKAGSTNPSPPRPPGP